jgi:LPXTG-motif cell wall-anchored protein
MCLKMKWILILILLAGSAAAETRPLDGGCLDQLWICRDIFCQPFGSVCGAANINITYPINNDTYYFPLISSELNFTLSGTNNPTCYYRTTGTWNQENCSNGDNTFGRVTWPQGYPLRVTVRVDDGACNSTQYIDVWVRYHHGAGGAKANKTVWIGVVMVVILAFLMARRKKRRWGTAPTA